MIINQSLPVWGDNDELPLQSQPFRPHRKRLRRDGALDRKYSVEVVNLVLQQFRQVAFSFDSLFQPALVLVLDSYLARALDSNHQVRETEAVVPQLKLLIARPDDFGIDERAAKPDGLHSNKDYSLEHADLRRGDSPPEAVRFAERRERVAEVADNRLSRGR